MNISPEQCFAEASNMALELRLKDRALAEYEKEIAKLKALVEDLKKKLAEHENPGSDDGSDKTPQAVAPGPVALPPARRRGGARGSTPQ